MSKEIKKPTMDITSELEKFRQIAFKLAALFFGAAVTIFYVIPYLYFVNVPSEYFGVTTYTITAVIGLVFVIFFYRVNIPMEELSKVATKAIKTEQGFITLTEEEEKALSEILNNRSVT